jgi:hypothetical protein
MLIGLRVSFLAVNKVRELNRVSDEEDGCVIADHVIIAFFSVKFQREAPWIPSNIWESFLSSHSRESCKHRSSLTNCIKEFSFSKSIG